MPTFITRVVNQISINLKRIHDIGIRRVVVGGLQPLGCLPQITVSSSYNQCNDTQNLAVNFHNQLLQQVVATLNNNTNSSAFLILDLFSSFNTVLKNKGEFTGIYFINWFVFMKLNIVTNLISVANLSLLSIMLIWSRMLNICEIVEFRELEVWYSIEAMLCSHHKRFQLWKFRWKWKTTLYCL